MRSFARRVPRRLPLLVLFVVVLFGATSAAMPAAGMGQAGRERR